MCRNLLIRTALCVLALQASVPAARAAHGEPLEVARDAMLEAARDSGTTRLLVLREGQVLADYTAPGYDNAPIEMMSTTKSVVALGVGLLLQKGMLQDLDLPVSDVFPEWRQGRKRAITLRQLMNHTSCLQNVPWAPEEISPSPDVVQLALSAELVCDPGSAFSYNNKALNLLAAMMTQLSGERMDRFLAAHLFAPLGITDFTWTLDDAGNPLGMSGLHLRAEDIAKLGDLVLQGGVWNGQRLMPAGFMDAMLTPSQAYRAEAGLLWWLEPDAVSAHGYLGQYIVVIPGERVVGVRLNDGATSRGVEAERANMFDFPDLVRRLAKAQGRPAPGE